MSAVAATAPQTGLGRALVLLSVILATTLYATTLTIANVALPQMQGDLSASIDQIAWVLTFNIVATAIATPPTGWLAARLGRKRLLVGAVLGFTISTVLCGLASSLPELIVWRTCQGLVGAPLVPLSQAITLDTFPRAQHGPAMALWGIGVMLGPILGPTVGGYMTELYNWRWVFFVVAPFGVLALFGCLAFVPETRREPTRRLDWFGFVTLSVTVAATQLVFDRGQRLDPDQAVIRGVEDVVQGDGELDHAEASAEMAAGDRDRIDGLGAKFVGELTQLDIVQATHCGGIGHLIEKWSGRAGHG